MYLEKNYHSLKYNLIDAFGADSKIFGYLKLDDSQTENTDHKADGPDATKPKAVLVRAPSLGSVLRLIPSTGVFLWTGFTIEFFCVQNVLIS